MKIALGTVQFGIPYGAFNEGGAVDRDDAAICLRLAADAGVDTLDTAPAYGESEAVLGVLDAQATFRIVTKIPALNSGGAELVAHSLVGSLGALRTDAVHGLLLHRGADLLEFGGERLWRAMEAVRAEGLTRRIGVSVYGPEELEAILDRFPIEMVQAPFSIFDQRLVTTGLVSRLRDLGIELHVRSIFLQGFALADPDALPAHLLGHKDRLMRFRSMAMALGTTPLRLALAAAEQVQAIDRIVVGVQSPAQLQAIIDAINTPRPDADFSTLASEDPELINPSLWRAAA